MERLLMVLQLTLQPFRSAVNLMFTCFSVSVVQGILSVVAATDDECVCLIQQGLVLCHTKCMIHLAAEMTVWCRWGRSK